MRTFPKRTRMRKEAVVQPEGITVPDGRTLDWRTPALVLCACSDCGAHAYRRLGTDGAGPFDLTGTPATCTVCGASELVPLDAPAPALAG